ncbi:unnamed protein product [Pieris macdunnoughi]|uniref:Uncharacterized protein n=1 Tax=Pieris macdunnoughi TaxID=345717 RepID=A0A821TWG3_9NEOP|nr:unnamed protein product [Pieris macdunnoughi]
MLRRSIASRDYPKLEFEVWVCTDRLCFLCAIGGWKIVRIPTCRAENKQSEIIIKHDPLYETLFKCLNKRQQIGLTLQFISALLYIDMKEGPSRRKSLYKYAQNMIRISGCLSALRIQFVSMMQKDMWIAMCRCLADVCRGCALNQTFCSDLIPMCISFCRRDTFVIVFLQSLLEGHEKNNRLFHLNDGMSIFTRESIYNTQFLQLLNIVTENVTEEFVTILKNNVFSELYQLRLKTHSEISQWASIILYSYEKGKYKYKLKWENESTRNETKNNCTYIHYLKDGDESDNTDELLKNVFREVANYNYYERRNKNIRNSKTKKGPQAFFSNDDRIMNPKTRTIDLSFSSLVKSPVLENSFFPYNNHDSLMNNSSPTNTDNTYEHTEPRFHNSGNNFYPISTSTPKKDRKTITKYENRKITKRPKKYIIPKKIDRSLSTKFLDVVNSSCTTIIKSIKSVFTRNTSAKEIANEKCGSFTEYMRNRDQYLSDINKSSPDVKSCITCNDTLLLQEKLLSDDCLKVTVKKLKHGINMFGCDFKKISKTFWPHEQCMTPAVLYNLYRKLIVK